MDFYRLLSNKIPHVAGSIPAPEIVFSKVL